jgi:hypothetical protein
VADAGGPSIVAVRAVGYRIDTGDGRADDLDDA